MATDWTRFSPAKPTDKTEQDAVDWSQFTPVEDTGVLRGAGDTGLSILGGLATGTKMVADAFGSNNAVSKGAAAIAAGLGDLKSGKSKWKSQAGAQRMEAAEASGSKWNEAVAGVKNFADQPLDMLAEGVGSSVPTIAAMALSRGKVNPLVSGAGMGAAQGAGAVKGQIFDDVKRRHLEAGLSEPEAEARARAAQAYSGENADQIALGAGLGAVAGTTGAESAVSRLIGHTGKGGIKPIIASMGAEGATEFAQGGQERLAANVAAQREGFDADTWQGVVGQGTMEGLAGAGSGAAFGAVEALAGQPSVKVDPNAGAISKALSKHSDVIPDPADEAPAVSVSTQPPATWADSLDDTARRAIIHNAQGQERDEVLNLLGALRDKATPAHARPVLSDRLRAIVEPAELYSGQEKYGQWVERSEPMPLDAAQGVAASMQAEGVAFYVAPHGTAGFTVVPAAWLNDEQRASFAALQGEGGRLPNPESPADTGVIRVDSTGEAAPETRAEAAQVADLKRRYAELGKPAPAAYAASAPTGTVQKAADQAPAIAAGIQPQAVVETARPGPRAIVETPAPHGIVENAPGPRGIVETARPVAGATQATSNQPASTLQAPDTATAAPAAATAVSQDQKAAANEETAQAITAAAPQVGQEAQDAALTAAIRPAVEGLTRRRAAAREIGLERKFNTAFGKARDMLTGKANEKPGYFKMIAGLFEKKQDPTTAKLFMDVHDALMARKQRAKADAKAASAADAAATQPENDTAQVQADTAGVAQTADMAVTDGDQTQAQAEPMEEASQGEAAKRAAIDAQFAENREALKGFKVGDEVEFNRPGTYTLPDGTKREGLVVRGKIERIDDAEQGRVKVGNHSVGARFLKKVARETSADQDATGAATEDAQPKKNAIAEAAAATRARRAAVLAVLGDGWKAGPGNEGVKDHYTKRVGDIAALVRKEKTVDGNFYVGWTYHGETKKQKGSGSFVYAQTIEEAAEKANALFGEKQTGAAPKDPKASAKTDKAAKSAKSKAERSLHVFAATDADALALAGTLELDSFISAINDKIAAQIESIAKEYAGLEADAIRELVQDGKPVLPRAFYESAYKDAKKAWVEQQKIAARDPQAYKETLAWGLGAKGITEGTPEAIEYQAGFDHALKGKTRSTLPQGGRHQDGYDDARAWIKTEDGKAWFDGKPRQSKQKNTGDVLKRVWDRARKDVDSISSADAKAWEIIVKATARADFFQIRLADDATPGAKEWLEGFRDKIATFSEYYTRVMVAGQHNPRARYGLKAVDVFTGRYSSYKGRIADRFGVGDGRAVKTEDERRLEMTKEVVAEYQQQITALAEKFDGLKTLADIQRVIEGTFGKPGGYRFSDREDSALYYDSRGAIESMFPKAADAWDAKYSLWKRLIDNEEAERAQKGDRKDPLIRPRLDRIVRNMPDIRNGRSIGSDEFKKAFNLADVVIGEYVSAQEAEDHLNYAYDALQSLALLLGAKPEHLSFGRKLYFTIGALGHGKYAAHFSPDHPHPTDPGKTVPVINVTKTRGDGAVLHEFFHAIDFMTTDPALKAAINDVKKFLKGTPYEPNEAIQIIEGFLQGHRRFNNMGRGATVEDHAEYATYYYKGKERRTDFYSNALKLDGSNTEKPYWSNNVEPWARAAESWGYDRLIGNGQRDDYLQSDWAADGKVTSKTHRGTPYPLGEERRRLNDVMGEFVKAIEWTDAGPVLREGHPWHTALPYKTRMDAWNKALDDAKRDIKLIHAEMKERLAREAAERDEENERKRTEAMFGPQGEQAKDEPAAEIEQPTASSEPVADDVPLSMDELSAIFDEESAAAREATQEEPEAEAPGAKLDQMAWTKEDAKVLLTLVNAGRIVLVADSSLGLPTIHDVKGADHKGFGVFHVNTPEYEGNFTAGGAMDRTPSGKGYTTFSLTRGEAPFWNKEEVAAKLRVLTGEPGKSVMEKGKAAKAKREGNDLPDLDAEQAKTASQLAGEFAKHGVKGLENTLDGLVKLFGGGPGKLQSFPSGFDRDTYEKAKPLFHAAAEEFRKAGMSFKEFVRVFFRTLIEQFGDGVKPYAMQFAAEYQDGYKQAEAQDPESDAPVVAEREPAAALSDWVLERIKAGETVSWQALFEQADKAFGGTQANGRYTPKDAYDAVELAVNRYIITNLVSPGDTKRVYEMPEFWGDTGMAQEVARYYESLLDRLPTQSKRTAEMDEFQQFSTPPHYAFVANWVANLKASDVYLEPSAGVGGLASFAKRIGVKEIIVNELSARRLALLRNLPFDRFFGENAEQLNNILPDDVTPSVVVMNPPFSATSGRMTGKRDTMNGALHIEQALKRLAPGGRLVAIVGEGMAADKPAFASWWSKIRREYNVRANIGIDGSGYAKYGTTFDNQIIVIDKTGPTAGEVVTGKVDSPADAVALLEAVRNDRAENPQSDGDVAGRAGSQPDAQGGGRKQDAGAPGAAVDPAMGGRGRPAADGQGGADHGGTARTGADQAQGGNANPSQSGKPGNGKPAKPGRGADTGGNRADDAGAGQRRDSEIAVEQAAEGAEQGEISNSVFETYTPKKVRIKGAVPHNTPLVESAAMAAVVPPDPTYTPNLPKEVIEKGLLSDAQLESVVYAGQAHQQFLKDGETRRGFFLGDGTGVGKGRQISGVILDNIRQGRTKAIWMSKKKELIEDAKRDFGDLGGDPGLIFPLHKTKPADKITAKSGILFAGYPGIRSQSRDARKAQKEAGGKRKADENGITYERIRQIVEWAGKDFDGVIVFDEAHEMGNAVAIKGKRGMTNPSDQALAGLELQKALPKARVMYVSATGATEVQNLAYAPRLGLWGDGTPFAGVLQFVNSMSASVSAMELVAQNLKQMGLYLARSLSFDGVTYERLEHELSPYQRDTYDLLAGAWQTVLNNIDAALKETGVMQETESGGTKAGGREAGKIKSAIMSAFWGSHQRFFNQIITAAQMPSILEQIERDLADGRSVVLQLTNTNEADQERALAKAASKAKSDDAADDDAIEELDLTPREQLINMIEKAFPVQQFEQYTDPDNPDVKRLRPVVDGEGKPVLNKEAVARRDEMIRSIRAIRIPDSPLQMLLDQFGPAQVAEITGRGQRVIKDENGKTKVEKRGGPAVAADSQAFKDGKKRILVFSQAGGTGFSFHADRRYKNRQKRAHYIVQAGWSADKAVQGFGRSHRTNQESAPVYRLAMTDIPAHKRFISSIARRLEQLGALTAGQRDTAGGSIFSATDNLESSYATAAVRQFFEQAVSKNATIEGFPADLLQQMGLTGIVDDQTGGLNETKVPTTTQFLNRLLSLRLDTQSVVFDHFMRLLEQQIEMARRLGKFDDGLQTVKHIGADVVQDKEVYRDPDTNSAVRYMEIKYRTPNPIYGFDQANGTIKASKRPAAWFKNKHSGRVAGIWETAQTATNKQGVVENVYGIWRTSGTSYEPASKYKPDGFERLDEAAARALWEEENAKRPDTREHALHMVVGGILPLWDRFNNDNVSVVRIGTDDGRRFLGREIAENDLADTLNKLNVQSSAAKMTGAEIVAAVMGGNKVDLSNGWSLKRVRVSGDNRIEILLNGKFISGPQHRLLLEAGAFSERIQWEERYFVPTDGGAAVDALLKKFGANAVAVSGKDDDAADGTMYSRTQAGRGNPAGNAAKKAAVQKHIAALTRNWANAPEIVVVSDMQDPAVPQAVRDHDDAMRMQGATGAPEAFYHGGKVYLVASELNGKVDVARAVFHEALGHAGLRGTFGDALGGILKQIVAMRRKEVEAKAREYGLDMNKEADRLVAAEEVLAEMAQSRPEIGFVKRAIAAIRNWLRAHGVNIELTDADMVQAFILPARRFVERGGKRMGEGGKRVAFARPTRLGTVEQEWLALRSDIGRVEKALAGAERPNYTMLLSDGYFEGSRADLTKKLDSMKVDFVARSMELSAGGRIEHGGKPTTAGDSPSFVRDQRGPASKVWRMLAGDSAIFQHPLPESFDMGEAAREINAKMSAVEDKPDLEEQKNGIERKWYVKMPDGTHAYVMERKGEVWIDASRLEEGASGGTRLYLLVGSYAEGNGKVFIGDPQGLSDVALIRRTENMLSLALRFGKTDFLRPHPFQMNPEDKHDTVLAGVVRPITWVEGDDANNLDELLRTSYANTVKLFPEIKNVTYNFDRQRFERDGEQFSDFSGIIKRGTDSLRERGFSKILSADRSGVAGKTDERAPVGSATLKRAAILNTVAREARGDRGGELLAAVGRVVSGGLSGTPLAGVLYSRSRQTETDIRFSSVVEMRASVARRAADALTTHKTFNNWWHRTVGTQYHKAQIDGDFRGAFNAVQNYLAGMAEFANGAADLADRLIPQLNGLSDIWNKKQPLRAEIKAIAAPIFAGTLEDERVYSGAELRDRFGLTDAEIDLYVQFRAAVDKSLDDLGKTDILRFAGDGAAHLRDEVMAAPTASRAAAIVAGHLNASGKAKDAAAVMAKGMRIADLKAKGYAPLTRFGQYTVYVTDGDEQVYFGLFESETEANAMARQMRADHPGAEVSQGVLSAESYKLFNGISPDTLELFADALGAENNEIVQAYIKLAKSNRSAMKRLLKRKGVAGFSEDVPRILASFITSNARMAASNVYGRDMDKAAEAIPKEKGDVKDEAIRMIEFARNPVEDAAKLRGLLFVQYIGGSVASALVNMTQPITMSFPYLHQFSRSAGAELARAMKVAATGGELDVDLREALRRAEMDGVVSPQEIHQLQAEAVKKGAGIGTLARMFGVKGEIADRVDDLSKRGLFAWGSMFSMAEQFNRRATFIAAYNIARQNAEADPFAFAEKAVVETQGIYNRGNRPDWARGAVGATVFTFKQYSISYMEFLSRLPKRERAIALAILVLAAGLNGIPFADDLDDLIDTLAQRAGYAWNTKAEKERFVAEIVGQAGADFVLHGTSALPGVPLDFAARLGMSNLLPGTGILLKNKTDKAGEVFEVLGPAGGVVKDALRGEFLPLAVRNAIKAADMAQTGMYRDYAGRKVIDTDGIDAAMKGIGFNPARVAREGRAARMDMQDVQLARNVESEIAEKMAQGVFMQDKESVAQARAELADWNAKNPGTPIIITSRQIMQRVQKMTQTRRDRMIASAPKELRGGLAE